MGAYPMVDEVIPCYPTHKESHSPFYESYHKDNDFPLFSVCYYFFWGIVSQGDPLWYAVFILEGLYFGRGVY